jgi:hypothetical protein
MVLTPAESFMARTVNPALRISYGNDGSLAQSLGLMVNVIIVSMSGTPVFESSLPDNHQPNKYLNGSRMRLIPLIVRFSMR